jgi:hypothetical protein
LVRLSVSITVSMAATVAARAARHIGRGIEISLLRQEEAEGAACRRRPQDARLGRASVCVAGLERR